MQSVLSSCGCKCGCSQYSAAVDVSVDAARVDGGVDVSVDAARVDGGVDAAGEDVGVYEDVEGRKTHAVVHDRSAILPLPD